MLSIITSTYKTINFIRFEQNVKETIGIEYEIIKIENPGLMGICEAYNRGKKLAKYPYLCFCHDDLIFKTDNWGKIVISFFKDHDNIGLLGIAGSIYKSWSPSTCFCQDNRFNRINIRHVLPDKVERININPYNTDWEYVATLDGCWLCTTKDIANQYNFDDQTFKNFHCYDIDYSLQIGQTYKLAITNKINIDHFSQGNYTREWFIDTISLHKKWSKKLPYGSINLTKFCISNNEYNAFCQTLNYILHYNVCVREVINIFYSYKLIKMIGLRRWFALQIQLYKTIKKIKQTRS